MLSLAVLCLLISSVNGFGLMVRPAMLARTRARANPVHELLMKLGVDEKVVIIGVAADSGCGKSTFMRRLTKVFGGENVGPLGGGFDNGGWETNTLLSDKVTVMCLDDYHANDRQGRKVSGLTALNLKEQNFDLMAEQLSALKKGESIKKPIYNHVNGTLDAPETIEPTPIVIIEGLHPLADPRVRDLLDFTIYLDISDDIKRAWKIQRDMAERGWTEEQVKADIEKRKPDFANFVAPQMEFSDVVISVLPSEISKEPVGKHLKVKMIQTTEKDGLSAVYIGEPTGKTEVEPDVSTEATCGVKLGSYQEEYFGKTVSVVEMDGKLTDMNDYAKIEALLVNYAATKVGDLTKALAEVGPDAPGSMDGTGLFQTVAAFKLREYYDGMK